MNKILYPVRGESRGKDSQIMPSVIFVQLWHQLGAVSDMPITVKRFGVSMRVNVSRELLTLLVQGARCYSGWKEPITQSSKDYRI